MWTLQPPRPEIELVARMQQACAVYPSLRPAILALKREFKADPSYAAAGIHSRHVYKAALDGIRDVQAFREWLKTRRRLPTDVNQNQL